MFEQYSILDQITEDDLQRIHDEKYEESSLTPRQWELYRLIKHNSLVEHRKTTQKEICDTISGYVWNDKEQVHDHCPAIWKDIKDNNESLEHDKIIISKNFEYWIGSERETKQFLKDLWQALTPRLQRYWKYVAKISLDGQGKILSNQNDPLTEKAKLFHESFNAYDIEMQKVNEDETDTTSDTQ